MAKSKDLFDDTTMSFGEHLEILRIHLWKAIIGLTIAVIFALFFGDRIVAIVRKPIDDALEVYGVQAEDDVQGFDAWEWLKGLFDSKPETETVGTDATEDPAPTSIPEDETKAGEPTIDEATITVKLKPSQIAAALHALDPDAYPKPPQNPDEQPVTLQLSAPEFREFRETVVSIRRPVTLNVQEAFMIYIKVAGVSGLVLASPWVFYQIWLFVAAGLYPHERKYVYTYLPLSLGLFLGGVVFSFTLVFPYVLSFLLGFNKMMGIHPQIRLSEWISFAIMLPLMFGISFQLPMVMLFLERISIFEAKDYREKRRISILVISIISMLLTPADPMSMMMMMIPLLILYEMGILLCVYSHPKSPFPAEAA